MPVAVRMPCTVAARRALLTVLFLGGFLALAFVLGGNAHAAVPSERSSDQSMGRSTDRPVGRLLGTADGTSQQSQEWRHKQRTRPESSGQLGAVADAARKTAGTAPEKVAEPTSEWAAGSVSGNVEPAVESVEPTAESAGESVKAAAGSVDPAAERVESAAGSVKPATRPLNPLTEQVIGVIGQRLVETTCGAVRADDVLGEAGAPGGDAAESSFGRSDRAPGDAVAGSEEPLTPATAQSSYVSPASEGHQARDEAIPSRNGSASGLLPLQPVPSAPVSHGSAGDGSGSRAGDQQHAVLVPASTDFGLLPGAVHTANSTPTHERHCDILVFPG